MEVELLREIIRLLEMIRGISIIMLFCMGIIVMLLLIRK